ncbi:hypothetical protein C0Z19_00855 [Trinickia soli]|uniref:Uncharacterized protein n=1 Tax=Trinickia soli TaxID=380675 RepID=A0A2N7WFW8_9BURK|nr:hypothetical protein C0Z19_00855 [Trinickia soli]
MALFLVVAWRVTHLMAHASHYVRQIDRHRRVTAPQRCIRVLPGLRCRDNRATQVFPPQAETHA